MPERPGRPAAPPPSAPGPPASAAPAAFAAAALAAAAATALSVIAAGLSPGALAAPATPAQTAQTAPPARAAEPAPAGPRRVFLETRADPDLVVYLYEVAADGRGGASASGAAGGEPGPRKKRGGRRGRETQAPDARSTPARPPAVVLFSGAFGWTPVLQETAARVAADGHPVLGVESPEYFKRDHDPATLAADLKTMREFVNARNGRPAEAPIILGGFAYGAEMVPYVLNRGGSEGVSGLLLVAPDASGASVFRVSIQLKMASPAAETFDVAAEIARLPPLPTFLIQGEKDEAAAGRRFLPLLRGRRHLAVVSGGDHQFREVRGHYLAQVSQALRWLAAGAASPAGPAGPEAPGGPGGPQGRARLYNGGVPAIP
jgi:hypothetical protein